MLSAIKFVDKEEAERALREEKKERKKQKKKEKKVWALSLTEASLIYSSDVGNSPLPTCYDLLHAPVHIHQERLRRLANQPCQFHTSTCYNCRRRSGSRKSAGVQRRAHLLAQVLHLPTY